MSPGNPVYATFELTSNDFIEDVGSNIPIVYRTAMNEISIGVDVSAGLCSFKVLLPKCQDYRQDLNTVLNLHYHAPIANAVGCTFINKELAPQVPSDLIHIERFEREFRSSFRNLGKGWWFYK